MYQVNQARQAQDISSPSSIGKAIFSSLFSKLTTYQLGEMFGIIPSAIDCFQRGLTYRNAGGNVRGKIKSRVPDETRAQICVKYVKGSSEFFLFQFLRGLVEVKPA